mmetsp:Transcript_4096/g.10106  ORF Transcript_4096/g.10106 Transcript_4096/m.10106 type:complete len:440 (+) Transcript_4096:45-1364(+)
MGAGGEELSQPTLKPLFFNGEEALREVARPDGLWNWALVGPDPDKLPLSGGGSGSIEEMQDHLGAQAISFGLLRMTFGTGHTAKTKFIYIHASNIDDENAHIFSMRERSQALAKAPLMERAVQKFHQAQVKVEITRAGECTLEHILEKLIKVSFHDQAFLTPEKFEEAMKAFREAHPVTQEEQEKEEEAVKLIEELAPAPENHEPEPEEQPPKEEEPTITKVRKKVRVFKPGDLVLVWSEHTASWNDDGEVVETLQEPSSHHGVQLNPGSMKVVYANGKRFKWVDPQHAQMLLKPSKRPPAPPFKSGNLEKETHSIFTEWHVRYFELSKGFLSWWKSYEDMSKGKKPTGAIPLLALSLRVEGNFFRFWTGATKGTMFSLGASSTEEANEWARAMMDHSHYVQAMRDHLENKVTEERSTSTRSADSGHHHRHHRGHLEEN